MKVNNETSPVKQRAEVWFMSKNFARGIKGPIPIWIIFLSTSLLFGLNLLYIIDIKKIINI